VTSCFPWRTGPKKFSAWENFARNAAAGTHAQGHRSVRKRTDDAIFGPARTAPAAHRVHRTVRHVVLPLPESHCATRHTQTVLVVIAQCDTSSARPPRRGSEGSPTPPSCSVWIDAVDRSASQQELQRLGEAVALALGQHERAGRGIGDKSGSFFGGFVHFLIMEKFSTGQPSSISIQGGCSSCCTLPTSSRNRASGDSACSSREIRSVNPLS
jgi:hypothetical protein